jgi:hypothetical protein
VKKYFIPILILSGSAVLSGCAGNDDLACQSLQAELDSKKLERRQFYDANGGFGMTTEARRGYNEFNDEISLMGFEMESLKNCVPDY